MRTSAPATSTSCSASPPATPRARSFLTDLTLDPPSATSDEAGAPLLDEDYLILSTIHSAKGQEWKAVYVLNVVDGCIPSDMATGNSRGDRGGAPPALRGHDPGQGRRWCWSFRSASTRTARPARRQARLRRAHPLHPGPDCRPFRDAVVADGRPGLATRWAADGDHRRSRRPHARHVARHRYVTSRERASPLLPIEKLRTGEFASRPRLAWTGVRFPAKQNANP